MSEEIKMAKNFNITDLVTLVDVDRFEQLLIETNYNQLETEFIVNGFRHGFSLEYRGETNVKMTSPNLKFRGIGSPIILWNKIMKEVEAGRYAGPFEEIPYEDNYIQSPIGLVSKDQGKDTRLIFHLSYPRGTGKSVNANIPKELCTVKYPDFNEAVILCLKAGKSCKTAKSDLKSAFRHLCMSPDAYRYLLMKCNSPVDGKCYYFLDKCLSFGASISCSHFQRVSNGIAHIVMSKTGKNLVNYLDDYLFAALVKLMCDGQVHQFLKVCNDIRFPVSLEKTFWGSTVIIFLGLLINTATQMISVPAEKIFRAKELINSVLEKKSKKMTLNQLQKVCGFLNFLGRCIIPGRAFTRRLYPKGKHNLLKPHHHLRITQEMKLDLSMWLQFLSNQAAFCRPFMDFNKFWSAKEIDMYSDAANHRLLGMGAVCQNSWMIQQWDEAFIKKFNPTIQYLELYALVAGVLQWIHRFANRRVVLFCDNKSVLGMVNNNSTSCRQSMVLIRILVLHCMKENVRIFVKHVKSKDNDFAKSLSRIDMNRFNRIRGDKYEENPTPVPEIIWPMDKVWLR